LKNGRCDREIAGKKFGKRKTGMRNDNEKNEMAPSKVSLHVTFCFFANLIKIYS
jgi:hypothetical protein